jgi:hypothetical protein
MMQVAKQFHAVLTMVPIDQAPGSVSSVSLDFYHDGHLTVPHRAPARTDPQPQTSPKVNSHEVTGYE